MNYDLSHLRGEWDKLKSNYRNQRHFFNSQFDWSDGISHLMRGPVRLEDESFEDYKDRMWVEKNLTRFYLTRGNSGSGFSKYHR